MKSDGEENWVPTDVTHCIVCLSGQGERESERGRHRDRERDTE